MDDSFYKLGGIYSIVHTKSKRIYIGSASLFFKRWSEHRMNLRRNKHPNKRLQNAWNKYGEEAFVFEIIEIIKNPTKELLEAREQYWIDFYKSADRKIGFNIRKIAQSNLGIKLAKSKKVKEDILEFCRLYGYRPSATSKDKIESKLGHKVWIYVDDNYVCHDVEFSLQYSKYPTYQQWYRNKLKNDILNFVKDHGHLPTRMSIDSNELHLYDYVKHLRRKNRQSYDEDFSKILNQFPTWEDFKKLQKVN
jgi:hypothetical protein